MTTYRKHLPQTDGDRIFLSDGGLETSLIYQGGFDLPYFAAFHLMKDQAGRDALRDYYRPYAEIAVESGLGFILESPTWRANPDWAAKLGHSRGGAGRGQSRRHRDDAEPPARLRDPPLADADQRRHRPARRRLPARTG